MLEIIIGNLCSLGAMLSESYSGTRKNRKSMLLVQIISQLFYSISSLVLKGYSAVVQNVISIARNLFAAFEINNKILTIIFVIAPVILGLYFNNLGLIGLIPIIANLIYGISVFVFVKEPRKLKYAFIIMCMSYSIFNFAILNIVGGITCIITSTTTFIALFKEKKKAN